MVDGAWVVVGVPVWVVVEKVVAAAVDVEATEQVPVQGRHWE